MISDISQFEELFRSLSLISQWRFEFFYNKGLVVESGSDPTGLPVTREAQRLSEQVVKQAAAQHIFLEEQYELLGVPVKNEREVIGSLIAHRPYSRPEGSPGFPGEKTREAREIEPLLNQLAAIVEDTWVTKKEAGDLTEQLAQSFEELSLYATLSHKIQTLEFSNDMLRALLEEILETVQVDLAFVDMPNREEYKAMATTSKCCERIPELTPFVARLVQSIPQDAPSLRDQYFILNDSRSVPQYMKLHQDPYRFLAVKIENEGTFNGWLGLLCHDMESHFTQGELKILQSVAKQLSILLSNIDLYQLIKRFGINVGKSLVYTIEAKDEYTRGHSERVNRYCMLMAAQLGMDDQQKELLNWASILHDIGKIGIPEWVLNKPDSLDNDEYKILQKHPSKGCVILGPLEQLAGSLPAIKYHHERYDGKGYPEGLQGKEIPFLARIISIADTFDAINSNRAYRGAKKPDEAMRVIDQVAGSQLDPDLVEVFRQVYSITIRLENGGGYGE